MMKEGLIAMVDTCWEQVKIKSIIFIFKFKQTFWFVSTKAYHLVGTTTNTKGVNLKQHNWEMNLGYFWNKMGYFSF